MNLRSRVAASAAVLMTSALAATPASAGGNMAGASVGAAVQAAAPSCVGVSYKANYNRFGVRQGDSAVITNRCAGTQRVFVNWRWPAKDSSCQTVYRGQTISIKGPFIARGSSAQVQSC